MAENYFPTAETIAETLTTRRESGNNKRLYKAESDAHKGELLSDNISKSLSLMKNVKRVNWTDLNDVQQRTYTYFEACSLSATYPSIMGLSVCFGVSREAVYKYMRNNPKSDVTAFLEMVQDVMADILTNQALFNNANSIQVMFQLKNHFGHVDRIEVQPTVPTTDNDVIPIEKLIQAAKDLPSEDSYDD